MGGLLDKLPYGGFITSLWPSGEQADPRSWLDRNGWQTDCSSSASLARSYGRALPDFVSPELQAASGLLIARRP
jgi:hypothetical protein